jgi:ATP-dependent Clp protease ATP-binding subunit ClpB
MTEHNMDSILSKTKFDVLELLKQTMRPEFLNRIDEIIMFAPLTKKEILQIVKINLNNIKELLAQNGITFDATDYAIEWIAQIGYDPQLGARPIKRVIQKRVLNELSKQLLAGNIHKDSNIILDVFNNIFVFRNKTEEK